MNGRLVHGSRALAGGLCLLMFSGCSLGLEREVAKVYTESTTGVIAAPVVVASSSLPVGAPRPLSGQSRALDAVRERALEIPPAAAAPASAVDDYIALAVERNPEIRRARSSAAAAGYRIPQVRALPNPVISGVPPTGDMTQTAAGEIDWSLGVTQSIPFPAKLQVRAKKASHATRAELARLRATVLRVTADVRRAYYQLYFGDRAIEITRESRVLLRSFRDIAARKYESGQVPQQDLLRAQVELADLENDLLTLGEQRDTAQARLNQLMAHPVSAPLAVTAKIAPRELDVALEDLLATADESNPEIAAARARTEEAREALQLAKLDYVPDFSVGYTYTGVAASGLAANASGDDNWRLGLGITLPIWFGKLSAGRNEALARLSARQGDLADVSDTTAYLIDEALIKTQTQQRLVDLFGNLIIPQAKQTLDATISAYRAGQVDFLTFVENWRRLLDFKIAYQRSLASFEQELAELQRVVGRDINGVGHGSRETNS